MDIWELLEEDAPKGCEAIKVLYEWSMNFTAGKGPFTLFLDLIGYSWDYFGEPMYDMHSVLLGYMDIDRLGAALRQYTDRPSDVIDYATALIKAEMEG